MDKGTLVEFRLHGDRRLAVADRPDGKKNWVVIDEQGQPHSLPPRQISYEVVGETYKPSQIAEFRKEVEPFLDPTSLEVAWEFLVTEGGSVDPKEMAQLLFSDTTPAQCYAAYCLLCEDKLYFKQKGDRYEPRSMSLVAELKHQQDVERARQNEWQEFLLRVQQQLAGGPVEWQNSDRVRIDALERFATLGEEANHRTPAVETLAALKRPETPQGAFQLLVDLKVWSVHENLFLRRSQTPTHFSTKVLEVAQSCLNSTPADPDVNRLDVTHLKVYTIDDESTKEIDDGLSVEYLPDGRERLWVHIADPTRLIVPGDELDLEARRRSTTIYLPNGMIPMFPTELATGPMSLRQGHVCCALSFAIILDEDGGVVEYTIHPTHIKPTYRLTYDDVDEMIQLGVQAEPEIEALNKWAKKRVSWRLSQGAISISMPEAVIKVDAEENITIQLLEDTDSRQLVAEMMILAGEVAAKYGQTHNLPLPYRHQQQPELPPDQELMLLPAGPVRACAVRRCMPKSEVSLTPARHASLGLDTYVQVTSPIRRYTDLMAHFQIKSHLRGDGLTYTADQLLELMMSVSASAKEASLVERQSNRYWALEYLRRHSNEVWEALMLRWLREDENLGLILLEELGLELAWRFPRPMSPGERLEVKVAYSDPRRDEIHFQEMTPASLQSAG